MGPENQHHTMPAASSKAARILRASLSPGTPSSSIKSSSANNTSTSTSSQHSRGRSHRRNITYDDTIDVNYSIDGEVIEGAMVEDPPLLTGVCGNNNTSNDANGDNDAYDFAPVSLSHHSLWSGSVRSGTHSPPLGAQSFLHQVSSSSNSGIVSPKKNQFGNHYATKSSSLDDPIPFDNSTDEGVRHGLGISRLVHNRRMCAITVAALALLGVIVGVGVNANIRRSASPSSVHGPGWIPMMPGVGSGDENEPHEYYPEPNKPFEPTAPSPDLPTSTEPNAASWLEGLHFEEPMLSTLGSALSFSKDGSHLAISAKDSDIVQVMKRNADGTWSHVGRTLPGKVADLSGSGSRIAIADASESSVTTYEFFRGEWERYGPTLTELWGARAVSLSEDGTTLAISHHPDPICRVCPSVATVYELNLSPDGEEWLQEYDTIGAYDFDFSVNLSNAGKTIAFSGRVYENENGVWNVKSNFPDFISAHSALSGDGENVAVSLPDCHIFKSTDPTEIGCTNTEKHEVSVLEFQSSNGGWWNRKGISIGPELAAHQGTTSMALSEDGNTIAIAIGERGMGGEAAVAGEVMGGDVLGGDAMGADSSSGALGDPSGGVYLGSPLSYDDDEAIDELPIEGRNNGHIRRKLQEEQQQQQQQQERKLENDENWSEDWTKYDPIYEAYETDKAFVQVYRYAEATGDWSTLGEALPVETSGATVALSSDGSRLAVGVPYGGSVDSGYVKVYDLVVQ